MKIDIRLKNDEASVVTKFSFSLSKEKITHSEIFGTLYKTKNIYEYVLNDDKNLDYAIEETKNMNINEVKFVEG